VDPVCWYVIIFRQRDYSLRHTLIAVGVAFGVVSIITALLMIVGSIVSMVYLPVWKINPFFFIAAPPGFAIWFAIGTVFLAIPYAIVAQPLALLQRYLLSKCFLSSGSAT
jgi:hypothetical protein